MFITMDVVFHEDSMYFSFKHKLQGEYYWEIQTLDYDVLEYAYHISEEGESSKSSNLDFSSEDSQCGLVNQEVGDLDGITFEQSSEIESLILFPPSSEPFGLEVLTNIIPNQLSIEDFLNLVSKPPRKQLPQHHTKGIPKPPYELELSSKIKYLMNNYVSNHRLSKSNQSFINELSIVAIPSNMQEAIVDVDINKEMKSLQKKK